MKMIKTLAVALMAVMGLGTANAQDEFEVSLGADVVSKYVWRGVDQGSGASIQPSLGLAYKGFSLSAWGSTSTTELDPKEFDVALGYSVGGFGVTVTDYWWSGEGMPYGYMGKGGDHYYEAALSYNFGESLPLTLSVATMFAGADKDLAGKQNYSTYINASYDIACAGDVTLTPSVGYYATKAPALGMEEAGFSDISLKASKEIKITDSFSVPMFVQAIASPATDRTYLVVGVSF